jgi:hypothetical protein
MPRSDGCDGFQLIHSREIEIVVLHFIALLYYEKKLIKRGKKDKR